MVTETSREAYHKIIPKLPRAQYAVWSLLRSRPTGLTNAEISYFLQWPINRVTPRIFELRKLGYVRYYTQRQDRITGATASVWVAVDNPEQKSWW